MKNSVRYASAVAVRGISRNGSSAASASVLNDVEMSMTNGRM